MMNDEKLYPVKKEIHAEGDPLELHFIVNAHFGTHDREESGEVPMAVINKQGMVFPVNKVPANWLGIASGVDIRHQLTYSGNSRESRYSLRIQPYACPVTIRVKQYHENSASDFPHQGEAHEEYYSLLISHRA